MFDQALLQKRFQAFNFSNTDFFIKPVQESFAQRISLLKNPDLANFSFMELHWENDPLLYCTNIHESLSGGGAFQGCFIGGQSLYDIMNFFIKTELDLCGKVAQRFSPLISHQSLISLLSRAGFEQIVVDVETYTFEYSTFESMMRDLRASGQKNALKNKMHFPKHLSKAIRAQFNENPIPAVVDVVYWSCFKSTPAGS
jgi:hypothetical protein